MKTLLIVAYVLAAAAVVRSEDSILKKYLEYLVPYLNPCAEEFELTDDEVHNVQTVGETVDQSKMGCLRACVMKRMEALNGLEVQMAPIIKMIETVHEGHPDEIAGVKKIATDCVELTKDLTDECDVGMKYADCYIHNLYMSQ